MDVKQILEVCKGDSLTAADRLFREILTTPTNARQADTFIQRFFNCTGLTYKEPVVLPYKAFVDAWKKSGKPEILYHIDFCNAKDKFKTINHATVEEARSFTEQYMGLLKDKNGNPYGQYHAFSQTEQGNGLYLGKYEFYEWVHKVGGYSMSGTAFRCFINPNAKIITFEKLEEEIARLREKYPIFEYVYSRLCSAKQKHGMLYSEIAAILGYDIIAVTEMAGKHYFLCDFTTTTYCVFNRSVLTICDQITVYESAKLVSGEWKEPGKPLFLGKGVKAKLANVLGVYAVFDGEGHYKQKDDNGEWHEHNIEDLFADP